MLLARQFILYILSQRALGNHPGSSTFNKESIGDKY